MRFFLFLLWALSLASCNNEKKENWDMIQGEWCLPLTNLLVVVDDDLIYTMREDTCSYSYRAYKRDSTILVSIPESEGAYEHILTIKIEKFSKHKDTLHFTMEFFGRYMMYRLSKN